MERDGLQRKLQRSGVAMPLGFLGEYEYRTDDKGRLPLPPKFRARFREGGILAQGVDRCIRVVPLAEWEKLAAESAVFSQNRSKHRRLKRFTFATAFDFGLDRQGRLALPPGLRQYAEIKEEVAILGLDTYLEIWDREKWKQEKALSEGEAWQISESLENR